MWFKYYCNSRVIKILYLIILISSRFSVNSKKVTSSRRITPTQVKSDGKKGKVSPAFSSSPFSSPHTVLESYGSPASLQEERNMLKLERARKKNKGDFAWGNRTSPSPQSSVRSPPLHVLGDFILSPPKQSTTSDYLEKSHSKPNDSLLSTPSPCKEPGGENCSDNIATGAATPQQFEEQTNKEKAQFIQVDKDKVVFHHKLDALAKVYSRCILGKPIFPLIICLAPRSIFASLWLMSTLSGFINMQKKNLVNIQPS